MRIAFLCKRRYMNQDVILNKYGRLYEFPRQLAEQGNEVRSFCLAYRKAKEGWFSETISGDGNLTWWSCNIGLLAISLPRYIIKLVSEIRLFQPDVLLGSSDVIHVIVTSWIGRTLKIPYVIDLYDNYESFGLSRLPGIVPLYRQALENAAAVVTVSQPLAELILGLCPNTAVHTIESTINPGLFHPSNKNEARKHLNLHPNEVLVGISGSLTQNRGIEFLYQAFMSLWNDGCPYYLVLVGDLDPLVSPPNDNRVIYMGRLEHTEMPLFYNALDVALICMRDTDFGRYAFPQKAYEILACARPIVATRVGALEKTLQNYPHCLYEVDDANSLASTIDRQVREQTVAELAIPSWHDQGQRLESILDSTLSVSRRLL